MKTKHILILACCTLFAAGCATPAKKNATRPLPGQRAIVVFKITHQDRAGESGTVSGRSGEIVAISHGSALIAGDEGDILHCPVTALHAVTPQIAAALLGRKQPAPDFIAAEELERWFPAQTVPFTVRWLPPEEIIKALRQLKP